MAFTFKSKNSGDITMLDANGRQLLQIIGKESGAQGVITPEQMPSAVSALEDAIARDSAPGQNGGDDEEGPDDKPRRIPLKHRAQPLIRMLQEAHAANESIHWGL